VRAFAGRIGASDTGFRQYLTGKSEPTRPVLVAIAREAGVNIGWLVTGEGEKHVKRSSDSKSAKKLTESQEISTKTNGYAESEQGVENRNSVPIFKPQSEPKIGEFMGGEESPDDFDEDFALVPRYDVEASAGRGSFAEDGPPVSWVAFRRDWLREAGLSPGRLVTATARGDSMVPTIKDGALLLIDTGDDLSQEGVYCFTVEGALFVKRLQLTMEGEVLILSDNPRYQPQRATTEQIKPVGRVAIISQPP